jgi:type II secretory pathway pseudopilin PulG
MRLNENDYRRINRLSAIGRRRAVTIVELVISLMILGLAMVSVVQLLATTARQQRVANQRRVALAEVANQAERIALLPWSEITADKLSEWKPSPELAAMLPAAHCTLQISDDSSSPKARQVRIQVDWTNGAGQPVDPVAITLWRFAEEGQE